MVRSFYNSKQMIKHAGINDDSLLANASNHDKQELYALPAKSLFVHLNAELLHPANPSNVDYSKCNILLVSPGSIKRTAVLESLKGLNFNKFVCLHKEQPAWAEKYFDDWIIADNEDISKRQMALEAVEKYCSTKDIKFDTVLSFDDFVISTTAFIQEKLKIPGPMSFEVCEMTKNKYEFRKRCKINDISCLKFFLIKNKDIGTYVNFYKTKLAKDDKSLSELVDTVEPVCINFPLIMKHSRGSGKGRPS